MLGSWTKGIAVAGLVLATGAAAIGAGNVASAAERYWNPYTQSWEWRPDAYERAQMRERAQEQAYLRERARQEWRDEQRERAAEAWRRQQLHDWRDEQRGWWHD